MSTQFAACVEHACFDGTDRYVRNLGRLFAGQPEVVNEHDRQSLLRRQERNGLSHLVFAFDARRRLLIHGRGIEQRLRRQPALAESPQTLPVGDAENPGRHF